MSLVSSVKNRANTVSILQLGLVPYAQGLKLQSRIHEEIARGRRADTLVLLEHPHTFTLGRRGRSDDILIGRSELDRLGVEVHHTDRGGEVTYHGPGQLVGYPIIDLRRWGGGPLKYVRALERVIGETLTEFGIAADSEGHPTGVWVEDRKIAAIGVKVGRRVTTHGFALNVSTDLSYFQHIVPCGMPMAQVTSMSQELGSTLSTDVVLPIVVKKFSEVFNAVPTRCAGFLQWLVGV